MTDIALLSPQPQSVGTEQSQDITSLKTVDLGLEIVKLLEPRTIDELIRLRAHEDADQKILSYPEKGDYIDYTFRQLDLFAIQVAQAYLQYIPLRKTSEQKETVIGLLGPSNLDYLITILALSKLGFTVLFLSTRISTAAYQSLLEATSAQYLLIHKSFGETAKDIKSILPTLQVHNIVDHTAGGVDYCYEGDTRIDHGLDLSQETNKISWIIHSSGSTGLPKPIYQTHSAALMNYKNNLNMRGFITLPLYHAHGISSVFRAFSSRKQIHMYSASLPLTQKNLLDIMTTYDFEILYGVPYALKLLGETEAGIEALKKLKVVMFGGSACPDALGDRLVNNGINLISHYGTTETGQLMTSFRQPSDKAWNYVRPSDNLKPFLRWEPMGEGIFELVILDGWPSKVAANRPDGAYATKDLFSPHPTVPDAWKYYARSDDTIVLLNGEKAVPTMVEQAVRQHKSVLEAVIFGIGKPQLGMLIIPSGTMSDASTAEVIDSIWTVIEQQNKSSAAYAQISRSMIKVLPVGTLYPRTDKGTMIRQVFYSNFKSEIENAYLSPDLASSCKPMAEKPMKSFLYKNLLEILGEKHTIEDSTDLFSLGMDSLQALRLRTTILSSMPIPASRLSMNIVFEFPSINSLTTELLLLQNGGASESVPVEQEMQQLIDRYGDFQHHEQCANSDEGDYVVVTGATGSLGAHLVAKLVMIPNVTKVYCLVRGKSEADARLRVISSMRQRSVYHTLKLTARQKIVCLPSNFSDSKLGLTEEVYSSVADNITSLIHCAWAVNFNLKLSSFENDCIAGAHNLILLCLAARRLSPAKFTFCSSVSAVASTPGGHVLEAIPASLSYAQNIGYAQSKLVTEHIVHKAAEQTGMITRTLRVGQIIGDTQHGIWNSTEAIPLMLQAGLTTGAIPALDESVLWLPVDKVAKIAVELSMSNAPVGVMNLVAHRPMHWTRELLPKIHTAGLEFEELGQREWINRLRNSNPNPVKNPPIKLMDFFAKKYDNDNIIRKGLQYDTHLARAFSPTLEKSQAPDQELISKIINNFLQKSWKSSGNTDKIKAKIIVIAGPCGSGKSTVATALSQKLLCPYIEGDAYHTTEAHEKMKSGAELADEDRLSWLQRLHDVSIYNAKVSPSRTVIVTCSALKTIYREKLRCAPEDDAETSFILLQIDREDQLRERMDQRMDHYMGSQMIGSQLHILENPGVYEEDILPVDATRISSEVIAEALGVLRLK